jgi:hypothetical protein
MPIANDFFTTFSELDISADSWVLCGKTINYLRDQHGISPIEAFSKPMNIEALFSEISETLFQIPPGRSLERTLLHGIYTELIFLFAVTVNSIANGPISRPHSELAAWLDPSDVIVTFNWDTLVERALVPRFAWTVDQGYGVSPNAVFRDGWELPRRIKAPPAPLVLKLHGSANWITAVQIYERDSYIFTHALPPESLFMFESATKPYPCYAGRYMEGYGPMTFGYYPPNLDVSGLAAPEGRLIARMRYKFPWVPEGTAPDDGLTSIPLIIPPEREKKYGWYGGLFSALWDRAEQAIAKCDDLVIIGYSFPRTDTRSLSLFKSAFQKRTAVPRVVLIDPNPARALDVLCLELGIGKKSIDVRATPFLGERTLC